MDLNREQLRTITGGGRGAKIERVLSIASFVGEFDQLNHHHSVLNVSSGFNAKYDFFGYRDLIEPKTIKKKRSQSMEQPRSIPFGVNKAKPTKGPSFFFKSPALNQKPNTQSNRQGSSQTSGSSNIGKNETLNNFMEKQIDLKSMMMRLVAFFHSVSIDKDQQRIHGEYYNNIYLGKRMFGPARKQKFLSTITGGMERRFEILDSQVEYQPFTHIWSDRNPGKCRNPQVTCKDDSRVELLNVAGTEATFIHANLIKGGPLFNSFILTQAPLENTIGDFWQMVWSKKSPYIFMLIGKDDTSRCASYWPKLKGSQYKVQYKGQHKDDDLLIVNLGVDEATDPLFCVTYLEIRHLATKTSFLLEHWQADMNDAKDLEAPLRLLHVSRNCSEPVIVMDHLGISRAGCLVSIETAICSLLRGPAYKHTIYSAIQFVRSQRPFCVETPIQYIYITRCVARFFEHLVGEIPMLQENYQQWLEHRAMRMFLDFDGSLSGHAMLSPRVDPDLLKQVRRPPRSNLKCEAASGMGELPLTLTSITRSEDGGRHEELEENVELSVRRTVSTITQKKEFMTPSMSNANDFKTAGGSKIDNGMIQVLSSLMRIKIEFLVQLDGVATSAEERLLVFGATNRPQELDLAAPRRFAKRLYVPLLEELSRRQMVENSLRQNVHSIPELGEIAQITRGYSGADM
ncbi:unnamed protein product, partial [Mesorhabditis belari]|uniref:Tyrosine-protein phosphatase domain-containing protein n=1 Tax=Mesorhabditis belari TaxID=2138241 RepID=A0AAF3FES5_9BILA